MTADAAGDLESRPAADLVAEAGRQLAAGDAAAAVAALREASIADPDSLRLHFMLGLVAWRLGELEQSLAILRQCHEREPMNGTVAEIVASLYAQAGNLGESLFFGKMSTALGAVPDLAELVPGFFPSFGKAFLAIREKPLFARARMLVGAGELREAVDLARQHVSLNPGDREARLFLGEILLRMGAAAAAVEALQPAAEPADAPAAALSLLGRALAAVGEVEAARASHAAASALAPNDAAIAAARLADGLWLGDGAEALAAGAAKWAQKFCPPPKASVRAGPAGKLVIGYLVSRLADPRDAAAIHAVASAHDRAGVTVLAYGIGAQSWAENAALSGAFERWRDISGLDPATLARIFRNDGLHAVVDCAGAAAPGQLLALARPSGAIRVAWLGVPPDAPPPLFEMQLAAYPLVRDWLRPIERKRSATPRFGADIRMPQLDETAVRIWSAVLTGAPEASLILRCNDMAPGANVERLIARFGRALAARIDIVDAATPEDFYADVDVALLPRKGSSPRAAAEAIACGVPAVALGGAAPGEPYGELLRARGLGDCLVAADEQDYVSIALGLATSAVARERVAAAVARAAEAGKISADVAAAELEAELRARLAAGTDP
jgi:predicted O-linked N-acetylglucosamine transferase (SPINDLY family)